MSFGWITVALALVLPWLAAVLWLRLLYPTPTAGRWPILLGYGYLIGLLGVTLLLRWQVALGLGLRIWPTLLVLIVLILVALQFARAGRLVTDRGGRPVSDPHRVSIWRNALMLLLVLLLVVRLLGLLLEVLWLPLYPWDAWTTWAVRAQVWTQSRDLVPFVDPEIWLNASTGDSHSIHAWHYPLAVSLLAAWPALAFGHWQETVANLPWIGCVLALVLGFYGQSVHWGATRLTAMVFTWLLLSLPLLSVHVALAGYADIWLATALGLSFFALMHWLRWGDWRQALLALLLAICCVLLKREGLVWVLLLLPAVLAARLRRRWLLFAMFAVFGLVATIWGAGGLQLHVPMLGEVVIAPDRLELPGVGAFQLQFSNAWEPLINHLYLRDNWHLLPFLVPVALLVGVLLSARDQTDPSLRAGLVWVMSSLFAVYILFFWTDASAWALQGTSINRILLHFAPAMTFWILTIWLALRQVGSTRSATLGGVRQG